MVSFFVGIPGHFTLLVLPTTLVCFLSCLQDFPLEPDLNAQVSWGLILVPLFCVLTLSELSQCCVDPSLTFAWSPGSGTYRVLGGLVGTVYPSVQLELSLDL